MFIEFKPNSWFESSKPADVFDFIPFIDKEQFKVERRLSGYDMAARAAAQRIAAHELKDGLAADVKELKAVLKNIKGVGESAAANPERIKGLMMNFYGFFFS